MQMNDNDSVLIPDEDAPPLAGTGPIAGDERGLRATVPRVVQSAGRTWVSGTGGERGTMRACDADRDRAAALLNAAYGAGRLSKEEYDARLENALAARTYADLDQVLTDLPARSAVAGPVAGPVNAVPTARTNGYAIASLACGLGQFAVGPLATIPAIVFGHMAVKQIRRTGEQGSGLAIAGLVLGWGAVILGIIVAVIAVVVGMHAAMHGMGGMDGMGGMQTP